MFLGFQLRRAIHELLVSSIFVEVRRIGLYSVLLVQSELYDGIGTILGTLRSVYLDVGAFGTISTATARPFAQVPTMERKYGNRACCSCAMGRTTIFAGTASLEPAA